MIRVYIKDNKIVKTVNENYIDTEFAPEWATYQDIDMDIMSHIVYEDNQVKLYKDSQLMQNRKVELESIWEKDETQQKELDYINSLKA